MKKEDDEYSKFVQSSMRNMHRYINIIKENLKYSLIRAKTDEEREELKRYSETLIKYCQQIITFNSKELEKFNEDNEDIEK